MEDFLEKSLDVLLKESLEKFLERFLKNCQGINCGKFLELQILICNYFVEISGVILDGTPGEYMKEYQK